MQLWAAEKCKGHIHESRDFFIVTMEDTSEIALGMLLR